MRRKRSNIPPEFHASSKLAERNVLDLPALSDDDNQPKRCQGPLGENCDGNGKRCPVSASARGADPSKTQGNGVTAELDHGERGNWRKGDGLSD